MANRANVPLEDEVFHDAILKKVIDTLQKRDFTSKF